MSAPRAGGPRTGRQIRDGDWLASRKRVQSKIQSPIPIWSERKRLEAAVSDDRIQTLRRQVVELDSVARRLNQSGLDSARAQLLLSRKRAELEDFINRGQRCQDRSDGTITTRKTRHG